MIRVSENSASLSPAFRDSIFDVRGGVQLSVAVEQGSTIHINTSSSINALNACKVCVKLRNLQSCQTQVVLKQDALLDFSCSQPEKVFFVQIIRVIATSNIDPKEHDSFVKFNRTFIWILKSTATRSLQLNFSSTGLKQIQPPETCPDKHTYKIMVENVSVGWFCKNGVVQQIHLRNSGRLSLEVIGGQRMNAKVIGLSTGGTMISLARILVALPDKSSSQDFLTPYFIPENAEVLWSFNIPSTYYTDVHILSYTLPKCLQSESIPRMKYTWQGANPVVKGMNEMQPSVEPGNFYLSIKNCKMSFPHSPSQSLRVHFQISAMKRRRGQCEGDLPDKQVLEINVKKKDPKSVCVLQQDSLITDTVTIASGKHFVLNTFDCNKDELELTVNQTIECKDWKNCATTAFPLTFQYEQQCIPGVLKTLTWLIHGPLNSAVHLESPLDGLRYCLPGDKCVFMLTLAHANTPSFTLGQFCPRGSFQKIQIRESNIVISASLSSFSEQSMGDKAFLTYSFTKEISENYIFSVAPKSDSPTNLATPGWPNAVTSSSTVSWIVDMEPQSTSTLTFSNISQPICKGEHPKITVQTVESQEMLLSSKTGDKLKDLLVHESFYINMTNCKSPTGAFRAKMEITVHSSSHKLLMGIILGVVGLVLVAVTAVVILIVIRKKKKKKKPPPVSVYSPSNHAFLPGLHGIPEIPQEDEDDAHTYVYIDDTIVYSDLLKKEDDTPDVHNLIKPPIPIRPAKDGKPLLPKKIPASIQGQFNSCQLSKTLTGSSEGGIYETKLSVKEKKKE
ncbi:hypothetical protein DNTS_017066 [Danionella cerebrum]|uniref:CUB domain-containing protein n=1 Tax=Danionella cerebrum TaxID=2873325 RepID=A0A553MUQ4_9TELE|nr:hypothetical protein DNTS_017066 [Danionella translucida]